MVALGVRETVQNDLSEECYETFICTPKVWVTTNIAGFENSRQELNEVNKILVIQV